MASRMKLRQELVGVNDGELSTALRGLHIDAFGLQARAEGIPVGERRHQDDALAVGERGSGEATDGAIEKVLVLVELHDVIARCRVGQKTAPRLALRPAAPSRFTR